MTPRGERIRSRAESGAWQQRRDPHRKAHKRREEEYRVWPRDLRASSSLSLFEPMQKHERARAQPLYDSLFTPTPAPTLMSRLGFVALQFFFPTALPFSYPNFRNWSALRVRRARPRTP